MTAVSCTPKGYNKDGKALVEAVIIADSVPATLPTTGENVKGLNADQCFSPMSVLFVTATDAATKVYIANESGTFIPQ